MSLGLSALLACFGISSKLKPECSSAQDCSDSCAAAWSPHNGEVDARQQQTIGIGHNQLHAGTTQGDLRSRHLLDQNPCAVTLLTLDAAHVLAQSPASVRYYASVPQACQPLSSEHLELDVDHPFAKLFSLVSPELADDMMFTVKAGQTWKCVLDVPAGSMVSAQPDVCPAEAVEPVALEAANASTPTATNKTMSSRESEQVQGRAVSSDGSLLNSRDKDIELPQPAPQWPSNLQQLFEKESLIETAEQPRPCGESMIQRDIPQAALLMRSVSRKRLSSILSFRNAAFSDEGSQHPLHSTSSLRQLPSSALTAVCRSGISLTVGHGRPSRTPGSIPGNLAAAGESGASGNSQRVLTHARSMAVRATRDSLDVPLPRASGPTRAMTHMGLKTITSADPPQHPCTSTMATPPVSPELCSTGASQRDGTFKITLSQAPNRQYEQCISANMDASGSALLLLEGTLSSASGSAPASPSSARVNQSFHTPQIASKQQQDSSPAPSPTFLQQQRQQQRQQELTPSHLSGQPHLQAAHHTQVQADSLLAIAVGPPGDGSPAHTRRLHVSIPSPKISWQDTVTPPRDISEASPSLLQHSQTLPMVGRDVTVAHSRQILAHTALSRRSWLPASAGMDGSTHNSRQNAMPPESPIRHGLSMQLPRVPHKSHSFTTATPHDTPVRMRSSFLTPSQLAGPEEQRPSFGSDGMLSEDQPVVPGLCFHEVTAQPTVDPVTNKPAILLTQVDVTAQKQLEASLAELARAQLTILSESYPRHIIEFFSQRGRDGGLQGGEQMGDLARSHDGVTVLFMDIVGFTAMSKEVAPQDVINLLNSLFIRFDALCDIHGVQKVDTAGDCYIVACGVLDIDTEGFYQAAQGVVSDPVESAHRVMAFAKDMILCAKEVQMPHDGQQVNIRIGMHTGPCVSGLVGTKMSKFSLFGDTMNTASRMESTCRPGRLQVSAATKALLDMPAPDRLSDTPLRYDWEATGGVVVKGKGLMETYLWVPPSGWSQAQLLEEHADALQQLMTGALFQLPEQQGLAGGMDRRRSVCSTRWRAISTNLSASYLKLDGYSRKTARSERLQPPLVSPRQSNGMLHVSYMRKSDNLSAGLYNATDIPEDSGEGHACQPGSAPKKVWFQPSLALHRASVQHNRRVSLSIDRTSRMDAGGGAGLYRPGAGISHSSDRLPVLLGGTLPMQPSGHLAGLPDLPEGRVPSDRHVWASPSALYQSPLPTSHGVIAQSAFLRGAIDHFGCNSPLAVTAAAALAAANVPLHSSVDAQTRSSAGALAVQQALRGQALHRSSNASSTGGRFSAASNARPSMPGYALGHQRSTSGAGLTVPQRSGVGQPQVSGSHASAVGLPPASGAAYHVRRQSGAAALANSGSDVAVSTDALAAARYLMRARSLRGGSSFRSRGSSFRSRASSFRSRADSFKRSGDHDGDEGGDGPLACPPASQQGPGTAGSRGAKEPDDDDVDAIAAAAAASLRRPRNKPPVRMESACHDSLLGTFEAGTLDFEEQCAGRPSHAQRQARLLSSSRGSGGMAATVSDMAQRNSVSMSIFLLHPESIAGSSGRRNDAPAGIGPQRSRYIHDTGRTDSPRAEGSEPQVRGRESWAGVSCWT